tara:strand:- start:1308 stop:1601 length:294 start_codon:yes stop_codon:yes gene_type:complete
MGLINLDTYTTQYGYAVTNTYISVGDNDINLKKDDGSWILEAGLNIWHSKTLRESGAKPYGSIPIYKVLSSSEINTDIFAIIYAEAKKIYTNTSDDL